MFKIPVRKSWSSSINTVHSNSINRFAITINAAGLSGGIVGGLGGVGGAMVMMPFLKRFTSMTVHEIAGASLAAVMGGTLISTLSCVQQKNRLICYPIAITMSGCSIFGAVVGIFPIYNKQKRAQIQLMQNETLNQLNQTNQSEIKSTDNNNFEELHKRNMKATRTFVENPIKWLKTGNNCQYTIIGTVAGVLTGLMALGGIVMVSYLAAYTDLTQHQVIATSLVYMYICTSCGCISYTCIKWHCWFACYGCISVLKCCGNVCFITNSTQS